MADTTEMIDLGRIGFVPKGEWNISTDYEILDLVHHNEMSYIAVKNSVGREPSDDSEYWQFVGKIDDFVKATDVATATKTGLVKPDGETITVDTNGALSAVVANTEHRGISITDNRTLTTTYDGVTSVKAEYTRGLLNSIATKGDELKLNETTLMLQLLSEDNVISEVSLAKFKGESYILTEDDKNYIANLIVGMIGSADSTRY